MASQRLPLLFVLILAVCLSVLIYATPVSLSHDDIDQRMQQFATQLSGAFADNGKDARLTYGGIDMRGWGFERGATITDVRLTISSKGTAWVAAADRIDVDQEKGAGGKLQFTLHGPVNVTENGTPAT